MQMASIEDIKAEFEKKHAEMDAKFASMKGCHACDDDSRRRASRKLNLFFDKLHGGGNTVTECGYIVCGC